MDTVKYFTKILGWRWFYVSMGPDADVFGVACSAECQEKTEAEFS